MVRKGIVLVVSLCVFLSTGCLGSGGTEFGLALTSSGGLLVLSKHCEMNYRTFFMAIVYTENPAEQKWLNGGSAEPMSAMFRIPCDMCILDPARPAKGIVTLYETDLFAERVGEISERDPVQTFLQLSTRSSDGGIAGSEWGRLVHYSESTVIGAKHRRMDRDEFCAENPG